MNRDQLVKLQELVSDLYQSALADESIEADSDTWQDIKTLSGFVHCLYLARTKPDPQPFEPTLVNMLEVARLAGCKSMIFRFSDD